MKVYELIEMLKQCDPNADAEVFYNGESHDIEYVESIKCEEVSASMVELHVW